MKNFTDTVEFKNEINLLKITGIKASEIKRYTKCMHQFDENGMEVGTDYSNIVLAFKH